MQNQRRKRITAHPMFPELAKFAVIGGSAYLTDLILFNILRTQTGYGPLTAKALSLVASIVVGFIGNRYWTYRERVGGGGAMQVTMQGLAFVGVTQVGNLIQITFLAFSHYVLGLTSLLADNVFGNVIGMGVATAFRFWGYRTWVFRGPAVAVEGVGEGSEGAETTKTAEVREGAEAARPTVVAQASSGEVLERSGRR